MQSAQSRGRVAVSIGFFLFLFFLKNDLQAFTTAITQQSEAAPLAEQQTCRSSLQMLEPYFIPTDFFDYRSHKALAFLNPDDELRRIWGEDAHYFSLFYRDRFSWIEDEVKRRNALTMSLKRYLEYRRYGTVSFLKTAAQHPGFLDVLIKRYRGAEDLERAGINLSRVNFEPPSKPEAEDSHTVPLYLDSSVLTHDRRVKRYGGLHKIVSSISRAIHRPMKIVLTPQGALESDYFPTRFEERFPFSLPKWTTQTLSPEEAEIWRNFSRAFSRLGVGRQKNEKYGREGADSNFLADIAWASLFQPGGYFASADGNLIGPLMNGGRFSAGGLVAGGYRQLKPLLIAGKMAPLIQVDIEKPFRSSFYLIYLDYDPVRKSQPRALHHSLRESIGDRNY